MAKNIHVVPHPAGGWQVKSDHAQHAIKRTSTQREAIDFGRSISRNHSSELVIHRPNGQIRAKDSYGHDPYPPKG